MRPRALHLLLTLALAAGAASCRQGGASREAAHAPSQELTVAAAASLRRVMPKLAEAWNRKHPQARLTFTYGGSGELRRQVEAGAPIDAVVFAHPAPVEALVQRGRVDAASTRDVARNTLVLVGRKGSGTRPASDLRFRTLASLPEGTWLAVGEPRTVPAGQYAHALLERLGLWDALAPRMVFAADVTAVLTYVRRGEAEVGIAYRTDLIGLEDVEVLDAAEGPLAQEARYVAAPIVPHAQGFVDFLARDPGARALWAGDGFGAP